MYKVDKMSKLECVIRYKHLGDANEATAALNEITFVKLRESKEARRTVLWVVNISTRNKLIICRLPLVSKRMVFIDDVIKNVQLLCPF